MTRKIVKTADNRVVKRVSCLIQPEHVENVLPHTWWVSSTSCTRG